MHAEGLQPQRWCQSNAGFDEPETARACQTGARTEVAATCTGTATRARNSTVEAGDWSVAIWAAVPLS